MSSRARILDAEALREITPAALRAYARSQGWRKFEEFGKHSDVYVLDNGKEAILPGTAAIADYATVVSEIIGLLATVEGRDELQIYRDLSTADQDVVRVQTFEAEDDGSVWIDAGVDLIVQARDLLLSAACSASMPRAAYRAGRVKDAIDYMKRVRLGQTERGSFIVTMLSPVPPTFDTDEAPTLWPMEKEDPFARRVTRKLAEGLSAAQTAIEKTNRGADFSAFEEAVRAGVSANLCEAMASLIERGDGLDVSVTWARTRPTPARRQSAKFVRADADVLSEAARVFRDREPRLDEHLEGYIVKLVRNEGERDGRATLRTLIDDRPVSVAMDLPQFVYEEAVRAHEARLVVSVGGDLSRDGQRWRLRNPRDLRLVESDEEPDDLTVGR